VSAAIVMVAFLFEEIVRRIVIIRIAIAAAVVEKGTLVFIVAVALTLEKIVRRVVIIVSTLNCALDLSDRRRSLLEEGAASRDRTANRRRNREQRHTSERQQRRRGHNGCASKLHCV